MEDRDIIELYWNRQEKAIEETAFKYDRYLHSIAYGILSNREDAEECVNDTYHAAWQSIPPHRPAILPSFLGKITRRIAISRWRKRNTDIILMRPNEKYCDLVVEQMKAYGSFVTMK